MGDVTSAEPGAGQETASRSGSEPSAEGSPSAAAIKLPVRVTSWAYRLPTRTLLVIAVLAAGLSAVPLTAARPRTADGKPCPRAGQLVTIKRLRDAVPAVKARFPGRWDVTELKRGPQGTLANQATQVCGSAVVRKSVFVRLHPHGQVCAACDLRSYVVRYRSGRYRVWYLS